MTSQGLEVAEETGDQGLIAYLLAFIGSILMEQGDDVVARPLLERSLAISQALGEPDHAVAHHSLARADRTQGDFRSARAHLKRCLALYRGHGWYRWMPNVLISFAGLEVAEGRLERAARLLGAADTLRETLGVHFSVCERAEYERHRAVVHPTLQEGPIAAAWVEGRAMTLDQAIRYALNEDAADGPAIV